MAEKENDLKYENGPQQASKTDRTDETPNPAGSGAANENVAEDAPAQESVDETMADGAEMPLHDEADAVSPLEAENADLKDRLLRSAAEMENIRRRSQREVRDAKEYAVSSFARDMLSVADDLGRALDSIPEDARRDGGEGFKTLIEGVELVQRSMLTSLDRHGVKPVAAEGERFDPNFHQAMFEVPNPDVPNNTVVQVVQDGYRIGERVLRPAMVGVAKGGPKQPKPGNEPAADAGAAEPGPPNEQGARDA